MHLSVQRSSACVCTSTIWPCFQLLTHTHRFDLYTCVTFCLSPCRFFFYIDYVNRICLLPFFRDGFFLPCFILLLFVNACHNYIHAFEHIVFKLIAFHFGGKVQVGFSFDYRVFFFFFWICFIVFCRFSVYRLIFQFRRL